MEVLRFHALIFGESAMHSTAFLRGRTTRSGPVRPFRYGKNGFHRAQATRHGSGSCGNCSVSVGITIKISTCIFMVSSIQ